MLSAGKATHLVKERLHAGGAISVRSIQRTFQLEDIDTVIRLGEFLDGGQHMIGFFAFHLNVIAGLGRVRRQRIDQQLKEEG